MELTCRYDCYVCAECSRRRDLCDGRGELSDRSAALSDRSAAVALRDGADRAEGSRRLRDYGAQGLRYHCRSEGLTCAWRNLGDGLNTWRAQRRQIRFGI